MQSRASSGYTTPTGMTGYNTPCTIRTMTTDASDDFLLLSDSPTYEDIENGHIADIESGILDDHKINVLSNIGVETHNPQKPPTPQQQTQTQTQPQSQFQYPLMTGNTTNDNRIHRPSTIGTVYSIKQDKCQFIYYVLIILFITIYLYSFILYLPNYSDSIDLGNNIYLLYVNIFNVAAIVFHTFIIILCLIFGYQYKRAKEYLYRMNKVRLNSILTQFIKSKTSKISKCALLFRYYLRIFVFEWTEFGIFGTLTMMHFILNAFLTLSQISNHQNNVYDITAYILTPIRYVLYGASIVLPALSLNLYHDHIRQYLFHANESLSVQTEPSPINSQVTAPPDIPENYQTDDLNTILSNKTHQTKKSIDDISGTISTTKRLKNIHSILNDGLIHIFIALIFIVFLVTYQMLCVYNWDNYNQISHIIYGDGNLKQNYYFIMNELILKLFVGIILINTILHIININDYSYNPNHIISYGFVTFLIKPQHVIFIIFMTCVEVNIMFSTSSSFLSIWNYIWIGLNVLLIMILFNIWYVTSKKANQIRVENHGASSVNIKTHLRHILDGIILLSLVIITNLLLYHDLTNWTAIRLTSCNIFNVFQLILIYTLKWIIEDKNCYRYVRSNKTLKSILSKLIMLNLYNICYTLVFIVHYFRNILDDEHNIYYRLSFVLSFTFIQFISWILCQCLCLFVEIYPIKLITSSTIIGYGIGGGSGGGGGVRGTKQFHNNYKYKYSASGSVFINPAIIARSSQAKASISYSKKSNLPFVKKR